MDATLGTQPAVLTPAPRLRFGLLLDGVVSGTLGLVLLAGGSWLAAPLGLPVGFLLAVAVVVLPFAGFVGWLSGRPAVPAWWVKAVIGANLAWVAASLVLPVSGLVAPSMLGVAFILFQAAAVGGFALLQWTGLRRSSG